VTPIDSLAPETPPLSGVARVVLHAWRGITRAHVKAAFQFGCAATLFHVVVWSRDMLHWPRLVPALATTFMNDQIGAFSLMLAIVIADRVAAEQPERRAPYVVAVVVSAAIATPIESILGALLVEPVLLWKEVLRGTLYFFFDWLVLAGTATFVYVDRRRARAALGRMHAAQLERAQSAKRTLESRLQAMQARVEPRFLFNTLARVRDLYRDDAKRGQAMLNELIAYLRAAMPRMRDTSSTVGRELELVRAYLGIERLRAGERLIVDVDLEPGIADARMPPMMLLPLVDHALADGRESTVSTSLRIRAASSGNRIKVVLTRSERGMRMLEPEDHLPGIRERLAALYGNQAEIVVRVQDDLTSETVLAVPCDKAIAAGPR
jgi:LytS/YehU family sensor histidine kinase